MISFFEQIIEFDKQLLLLGNSFHTPFWDNFVLIFSGKIVWIPAVLAILYAIVRTQRRDAIWTILFLAIAIVLADQISSSVIKPLVCRWRPTHEPTLEGLVTVVHGYAGGRYGFVSSHAANACAVALFTSLIFRRKLYTITIWLWAVATMYSRVYLGVHYPGDIICGAVVGLLSAWVAYALMRRLRPQTLTHSDDPHLDRCVVIIASVVAASVVLIAALNQFWEALA